MSQAKVLTLPDAQASAPLAAGLHPARIEEPNPAESGSYVVRLPHGERLVACLADDMEEAFADECCRDRRRVLLSPDPHGRAMIIGALQTSRSTSRDTHDTLRLEGRRVEIEAEQGITMRVGKSTLRLDKTGAWKMVGNKMTMDIATVVRVLSSLVELP